MTKVAGSKGLLRGAEAPLFHGCARVISLDAEETLQATSLRRTRTGFGRFISGLLSRRYCIAVQAVIELID
jgi:hypothetical protein